MREETLVKIVDSYWNRINIFPQGNRGNYSFRQVLAVAKALRQSSLIPYFRNDYVIMYGSFVNGKANLQHSDIDLHLGPQFLQEFLKNQLTSAYHDSTRDTDSQYSKIIPTAQALEMSKHLINTEKSIARIIGRSAYDPSQLLTVVPQEDSLFEVQNLGYYNSLVLKITPEQITLLIVDTFGGQNVFRLVIK